MLGHYVFYLSNVRVYTCIYLTTMCSLLGSYARCLHGFYMCNSPFPSVMQPPEVNLQLSIKEATDLRPKTVKGEILSLHCRVCIKKIHYIINIYLNACVHQLALQGHIYEIYFIPFLT